MVNLGIPKERILVSYEPRGKGHQQNIGWNYKVDFIYSDDFFKTIKTAAHKGNKFLLTKRYLFVAQVLDQEEQEVMLLVTNAVENHYNLQPIELSKNSLFKEHSYTFLDTSEKSVFIHVNHFGEQSKFGHIYSSDFSGQKYSLSLPYNIRLGEGQCDFDKVNGLDGIYLSNVIDSEWVKQAKQALAEETLNEENQMANVNTESGAKPTSQKNEISKLSEQYKDFVETYITFNKGGKWHRIAAPERDLEGKRYECGENCFLNLHAISNSSPPFYSVDNASGIIIANGNVGKYLNSVGDEVSTYLSRDGGFKWVEVKKGSHNYEFGDHGAIIILADDSNPTNTVSYSWDEGQTWNDLKISRNKVLIRNIIIEPNNISQHFLIYGQSQNKKGEKHGIVIAIDFTGLNKPQCRNPFEPNSSYSDYETWSPNDGRLGHNCLLGKKYIYIRRKKEAECYNGEMLEKKTVVEKCQCTDDDFECDIGYMRKNKGDPCTKIESTSQDELSKKTKEELEKEMYNPPEICHGYYTVTKGYRRVPGDECEGGVNYDPILIACPYSSFFSFIGSILVILLIGALVALIYMSGVLEKLKELMAKNEGPGHIPIDLEDVSILIKLNKPNDNVLFEES